eukprot:7812338-Lingulodinium_polyedra.AAC.1
MARPRRCCSFVLAILILPTRSQMRITTGARVSILAAVFSSPMARSKVERAQFGGDPLPGRDSRAKPPKESVCPARTHYRSCDDGDRAREIAQRVFRTAT